MSILQTLMTAPLMSGSGEPPPPPPPPTVDFNWYGDQDYWIAFGGIQSNSIYSDPAPANPNYTYADGTSGKTRNFTGTQWMISQNLRYGGAWPTNAITVNIWFYPTVNNCQIMAELGEQSPNAGWHYSMLEIDSFSYIRARFWNGSGSQSFMSNNTVELNQWNHIRFAEDTQGGHIFELNGVPTNGLPTYFRQQPNTGTGAYIAMGISESQNMVTTNPFQGKIGYLQISDYVADSTYTSTLINRFRRELTSGTALTFNGTDLRYAVVADNLADWNLGNNWTIEWWQNIPAAAGGFMSVVCQDANVPTYSGIDVFVNNGSIQMFNGNRQMYEGPAIRDQWNHIALQNNGGTLTGYINGQPQGFNGPHSGTIAPSSPLNVCIGSRTWDGGVNHYGQYFNGKLANIRISTVARYTGTFTPPLTVETDQYTKLSLDGSSGGDGMLIDELARHTITNFGAIEDTIT
jgi:hypothetical protein